MAMAKDKWKEDFLPVIDASVYRELLPTSGEGSRGGDVKQAIKFRNGATMRFMTAGGNDKKLAAYTSRVVAITEADGMDEAGETSREADKIEQIEARTRAFGRRGKRVYLECTVSIERGRIWQELKNGSDSKILRPCLHCGEYVLPEREHLKGWQQARSEEEADTDLQVIRALVRRGSINVAQRPQPTDCSPGGATDDAAACATQIQGNP
jgi:phage terminase large subunit GpA-like protein